MKKYFNSLALYLVAFDGATNPDNNFGLTPAMVDEAIPEFWANVALGALRANCVMASLVNRDYSNEIATHGDAVNIVRRGALTVNDKTPGKTITIQNPNNTKQVVILDKHKEISWLIEDVTSVKAINDAINYVTDAAIAIAEQIDLDILVCAIHKIKGASGSEAWVAPNATGGGNCGVKGSVKSATFTKAVILQAREILNKEKAPVSNRIMVLSPEEETALLAMEEFTKYDWSGENPPQALINATIGKRYGITFLMDQMVDLAKGNVSDTLRHNIMMCRDTITLVTRPLPAPPAGTGATSATIEEGGISVRVTKSYSQKDGGMLYTLDLLYGLATLRPEFGVDVAIGTGDIPVIS